MTGGSTDHQTTADLPLLFPACAAHFAPARAAALQTSWPGIERRSSASQTGVLATTLPRFSGQAHIFFPKFLPMLRRIAIGPSPIRPRAHRMRRTFVSIVDNGFFYTLCFNP